MANAAESAANAGNLFVGVGGVVELAKKAIIEVGCEHKAEVIAAADKAIDGLVAVNLPQVPDALEQILDAWLASYAKNAVRQAIDRICGTDLL